MSDEPKKRSRAWIGLAALLMLLVLYPLSIIPAIITWRCLVAYRVVSPYGPTRPALEFAYAPVVSFLREHPALNDAMRNAISKITPPR
jgi:hypothetical protein